MATDYGIGIAALTDRPMPEVRVSGALNLGYRLARYLLTPDGAMADVGDPVACTTLNLRDYLADRPGPNDLRELGYLCQFVLSQDEQVLVVGVTASLANGVLSVSIRGNGTEGPFAYVIAVNAVTGAFLQVQQ